MRLLGQLRNDLWSRYCAFQVSSHTFPVIGTALHRSWTSDGVWVVTPDFLSLSLAHFLSGALRRFH